MSYLPLPTAEYRASLLSSAFRTISAEFRKRYSKDEDVEVLRNYDSSGTETGRQRLILQSPNGTRYEVTTDNSGNLTTTAL